jgi:predicted lactoylglutathione lyase
MKAAHSRLRTFAGIAVRHLQHFNHPGRAWHDLDLYVAFTAKRAEAVRACYKAAIDAGGTSNKEPSLRPEWRADYFAANIGDPDGYNIEIAYKPWLYK